MSKTIEFSNTCDCFLYTCEDCGLSMVEDFSEENKCIECGSENLEEIGPSAECSCWEGNLEFAQEIWETWADSHPAPYGWYICDGRNLGWQNQSGLNPLNANVDSILEEFSLDTDWTMYFPRLQDVDGADTFRISRAHHDAPTGESIEIKPATFEEAIWCIENAEGLADSWIYEIQELMENHYEIGMLSDERVIEICEDVDLDPADYLQEPEKFGF